MNYQETIDYLYNKLPMFSRIGEAAIKKDLTNTILLCEALKHPERKFKAIHIAGTNGKGSVAHMLASVLQEAGYKTGLYTSPHLTDFRERIKINGTPCSEKFVIDFTKKIQLQIESIAPSFFEITVAMAFEYFAKKKVDIAIIETGLGGRLDSTNVISPIMSVITNISLDHQYLLGNTLAEIASEKAGIIKLSTPIVIGRRHPETDAVFEQKAQSVYAKSYFAEDFFTSFTTISTPRFLISDATYNNKAYNICCDLQAVYQKENIRTALAALILLNQSGQFTISNKAMQIGFSSIRKNTNLQGRWQLLDTHPRVIADVGHNEDGVRHLLSQLKEENYHQLHIIIGVVKDKDVTAVLSLLPTDAIYYFTEPPLPRKLEASALKEKATLLGLKGEVIPHPKDALGIARSASQDDDLILVMGSFFVVSEVLP